ncbi:hypothetical protein D3C75_817640 [compost metagenome]
MVELGVENGLVLLIAVGNFDLAQRIAPQAAGLRMLGIEIPALNILIALLLRLVHADR